MRMANDKAVYSIECDCFRHKYISLPKSVSSSTGAHVTLDLDQVAVSRRLSVQVGAPWGLDRIDTNGGAIDGEYDDGDLTGQGVRVYIVDTGVQGSHVDFEGRVVPGHTVKAAPVVACIRSPPSTRAPATKAPRAPASSHHPAHRSSHHPRHDATPPHLPILPRRHKSTTSVVRAKPLTASSPPTALGATGTAPTSPRLSAAQHMVSQSK